MSSGKKKNSRRPSLQVLAAISIRYSLKRLTCSPQPQSSEQNQTFD
uniref:Uncharacterized protein n=1 Tax=Anguilla anguilla TaxID=7936 RepID=A0A0E9UK44_ANGAN